MMGHRQVEQAALFYEFSLERHVPSDHLLRSIDRFVELGELRRELAPFYSNLGRPSVDPELMIRILLVGYCFGIRSERRLCEEVHLNLAYRWFCRLGLDGPVPDHSTFSKNRHGRFRQSDLLRRLFETVLHRCINEGLVGGENFAVDASLIKADANRQKGVEGEKGLPPQARGRAVQEYLAVLDDAAFGAATEVTPKFISPADPAARWTGAHGGQGDCQNFCVRPVIRHEFTKRSLNMTANCVLASAHSRGGLFHSAAAWFKTRYSSFVAASSEGKCPLVLTARRSFEFNASMAFVV
jgi:transposase